MSINTELQDAIRRNLPAEIGATLRGELESLATTREENARLKAQLKELNTKADELRAELQRSGAVQARDLAVSVREEEIAKREHAQEVFEAKLKAAEAEKRAQGLYELVALVFKNQQARETVFSNDSVVLPAGTYLSTAPKSSTTLKEID